MLPVPPEMIPRVWKNASTFFRSIPDYDLDRLRMRLLVGSDTLWLIVQTAGNPIRHPYMGAITTTVSDKPPNARFPIRRSLTVHLAGGEVINGWIKNAVERITAYGREQQCRQLFLVARKGWCEYAMRFFSRDWDTVAYSRDRRTESPCRKYKLINRPGFFRVVTPMTGSNNICRRGTRCYAKEGA